MSKKKKYRTHSKDLGKESIIGIPVVVPDSLSTLPDPLWLSERDHNDLKLFERALFEKNNIKPGIYSSWKEAKEILIPIHDKLLEETDKMIKEFDRNQLIIELYDQLEIMYWSLEKRRYEALALAFITKSEDIMTAFENEWRYRSPQTLGTRYLI